MDIMWNIWTVVQSFKYIKNECKNNKRLVKFIDRSMIEGVHAITKISIQIT